MFDIILGGGRSILLSYRDRHSLLFICTDSRVTRIRILIKDIIFRLKCKDFRSCKSSISRNPHFPEARSARGICVLPWAHLPENPH